MDQFLIKVLALMFLFSGLVACVDAWAGKWGAALAMLGFSVLLFVGGAFLARSYLLAIPAFLFVVFVGALFAWDALAVRKGQSCLKNESQRGGPQG